MLPEGTGKAYVAIRILCRQLFRTDGVSFTLVNRTIRLDDVNIMVESCLEKDPRTDFTDIPEQQATITVKNIPDPVWYQEYRS